MLPTERDVMLTKKSPSRAYTLIGTGIADGSVCVT